MSREIKLKPCPHCGGEAELFGECAPEYWVACVIRCTDSTSNKHKAVEDWNRRNPELLESDCDEM